MELNRTFWRIYVRCAINSNCVDDLQAHILFGLIMFLIWRYVMGQPKLLGLVIDKLFQRWANIRLLFILMVVILTIIFSLIDVRLGTYSFLLVPLFLLYSTFEGSNS